MVDDLIPPRRESPRASNGDRSPVAPSSALSWQRLGSLDRSEPHRSRGSAFRVLMSPPRPGPPWPAVGMLSVSRGRISCSIGRTMDATPPTRQLVASLAANLSHRLGASPDWTAEVFQCVAELLHGPNRTVHAARRRPNSDWCPEYLLDVTITDDDPDREGHGPFGYRKLLLALECEWGPSLDKLRYDFCKLVDVRAARKVFVGYVSSSESADGFAQQAQEFLNSHDLVAVDEEYGVLLFAGNPLRPSAWILSRRDGLDPVA
jgi:hypothetical protein